MAYPGPRGSFPSIGNMYPPYLDHSQQQYHRPHLPGPPPITIPTHIPQPQPYHQYTMSSSSNPPPSPSQESDAGEEKYKNLPQPSPISRIHDGKAYLLEIGQQPQRARMCGFGDKDRRPISPPPCIRLRIIDPNTHKDIDYTKIDNLSRFVLMVDLADPISLEEKNIVKHSSQSPSISTVTTTSYPPTSANGAPTQPLPSYNVANAPGYSSQSYAPPTPIGHPRSSDRPYSLNGIGSNAYYGNGVTQYSQAQQGPFAPRYNPQFPNPYSPAASQNPQMPPPPEPRASVDLLRSPPAGTCTRNLIGSLSGSAFKLKDLQGEVGLWFVFQDLSVRTEGFFRLKFTFFDLMSDTVPPEDATTTTLSQLAPMLACTYSNAFHVYSAKKFPGVIESTELSKEFARQGIKIPIRKDGARDGQKSGGKRKRDGDDESDMDSDRSD